MEKHPHRFSMTARVIMGALILCLVALVICACGEETAVSEDTEVTEVPADAIEVTVTLSNNDFRSSLCDFALDTTYAFVVTNITDSGQAWGVTPAVSMTMDMNMNNPVINARTFELAFLELEDIEPGETVTVSRTFTVEEERLSGAAMYMRSDSGVVNVLGITIGATTASSSTTVETGTITTPAPQGAKSLLEMLAGIPQAPVGGSDEGLIYFIDYSAWESVYGVTRPADYAEFDDTDSWDTATTAWWALFMNASWHPARQSWMMFMQDGPETVGFSPLEIDRAIEFGVPPSMGLTVEGDFDAEAISAAFEKNFDLAAKSFSGTTVWCWGDDPEAGFDLDPANREMANPFGGEVGRRQPVIISDDLVMSSADLDVVLACAAARAGEVSVLADVSAYRVAVDAVAEEADILQATIAGSVSVQTIASLDPSQLLGASATQEQSGAYLDSLLVDYQDLPVYELIVAADVATADEQIARLAFVFPDDESAETAAGILLDRLYAWASPRLGGDSYAELLIPSNGTAPRYYVSESAGRAVLVLEFPAPRLTTEEIAQAQVGQDYSPVQGFVYRKFLNMFSSRDTAWLTTATQAELEALR